MKNKVIKTSLDKAEKIAAHYKHFGYKLINMNQQGSGAVLEFDQELGENEAALLKLEKEYKKIDRKFPTGVLVWVILGIAGLFLPMLFKSIEILAPYSDFTIIFSISCFGIALFLAIIFVTILINKNKIINRIYLRADRLCGNIKDLPLKQNIAPASEFTGNIKRNIKNLLKK